MDGEGSLKKKVQYQYSNLLTINSESQFRVERFELVDQDEGEQEIEPAMELEYGHTSIISHFSTTL